MIEKHLHLRRRKDGVEVITLEDAKPPLLPGSKKRSWNSSLKAHVPVRYVASGRKGYIKSDDLETEFVVIGSNVDIDARWAPHVRKAAGPGAAALEDLREQDIQKTRKRILESVGHPQPRDNRTLGELRPSPNALSALDSAIHMILAGT